MRRGRSGLTAELAADFRGRHALTTTVVGVVAGVVAVSYAVSVSALVFRGDLADHVASGVGLSLWSTFAVGLIVALTNSMPGTVPSSSGKSAAVLAVAGASIVDQVEPDRQFATVLAVIVVASAATGVACLVLGRFRLGGLVRYVPFPVVGGFMAATGLLMLVGGWDLVTPGSDLLHGDALGAWIPAVVVALALLAAQRSAYQRLLTPSVLLAAPLVIHLGLWVSGVDTDEALARGWLLSPKADGALWRPDAVTDVVDADWSEAIGQVGGVATIVLLVIASLLLYAHALEVANDRDVDVDRELRATGWGSLLGGAGGGLPAYTNLPATLLAGRLVEPRRGTAVVAALVAAVALVIGADVIAFVPTSLVGGLLMAIGVANILEWLWDTRDRLARFEVALVLAILAAVALFGFVAGTAFGVIVALVLFVIRYSRVNVIRSELTGRTLSSNVERTPAQHAELERRGDELVVLDLRGYLFFGTATAVTEAADRWSTSTHPPRVVVLDFTGVTGLDSSALIAFEKVGRRAHLADIDVVLAGAGEAVVPRVVAALQRVGGTSVRAAPDIDHGLQQAEELLLADAGPAFADDVGRLDFGERFDAVIGTPGSFDRLRPHLRRLDLASGDVVIRQGRRAVGLYFVESGRMVAVLEQDGGARRRLRSMLPGTVIGEIGYYLDGSASATVEAETDSVVLHLSSEALERIGDSDPGAAAALHLFAARTLAERLTHAERAVRALRS